MHTSTQNYIKVCQSVTTIGSICLHMILTIGTSLQRNQHGVICTLTRQAGHPKNHGSIVRKDTKFICSPKQLALRYTHPIYVGTCTSSLAVNWTGLEANQSPPYNTQVKNKWSYLSTPTYAFMACTRTILTSCNRYSLLSSYPSIF
jgi:hypothetical protein